MEKNIIKKVDASQVEFKNSIKKWIESQDAVIKSSTKDLTSEFMKFVFDYNGIVFVKEDFQKRKRVKNLVPEYEKCIAKRANKEQCTRRKIPNETLCGTHSKGTPHGVIDVGNEQSVPTKKTEVWVEEIKGINYYIDNMNNVYKPEDIISNKENASIIAKWTLDVDGSYKIPLFGI
jgi:hypothetical protein